MTRIYLVSVAYLRVWQKDHLSLFQDQLRSAQRQAGCFLLVNGEALRGLVRLGTTVLSEFRTDLARRSHRSAGFLRIRLPFAPV